MNAPIMTDAEKLREIYAKQNGLPYPGPAPSAEPTLNYSDLSENEDLGEPESQNPWMTAPLATWSMARQYMRSRANQVARTQ